MLRTAIQPHEMGAVILERAKTLLSMKAHGLDPTWVKEFDLQQLMSCCDRLAVHQPEAKPFRMEIQRELIQNPDFAAWFARLLALNERQSTDGETEGEPQPGLATDALTSRLSALLEVCWKNALPVTAYAQADVLPLLVYGQLTASAQLAFLAGRAPMDLSHGDGAQLAKNLTVCGDVPVPLNDEQWALIEEPFVETRWLFQSVNFERISELFHFCPELLDIARLFHEEEVPEQLRLKDYMYFAEDAAEYLRLLTAVIHRLGSGTAGAFIRQWQKDNCALSQLRRMECKSRTAEIEDWQAALASYGGYLNLLHGTRFKTLPLTNLSTYAEKIITYAILHNKKHFIKTVDENAAVFLSLPRQSILFYEGLYQGHFNLNELTAKDLSDCIWMTDNRFTAKLLEGSRTFTFAELKLLYDSPPVYSSLYGLLRSENLDYRIKVLRQLRKRDALSEIKDKDKLPALATLLDQKPLYDWRHDEFGHIGGLTAGDTVKMLIHLEELRHLLPDMSSRTDAMLALRSLDILDQFDSMDALKCSLFETDPDWHALADAMQLSPEFKARHRDTIIEFLCKDGAGIVQKYVEGLDHDQHMAFHRVVKAELMGQFNILKYHEGDLERELDYPVTPETNAAWQKNLFIESRSIEVREHDDFFATMLLGTQPYETCLSYLSGCYRHCLLACFDSNKKVLYAVRDGQTIGRACIRLTKSSVVETKKKICSGFHFVDLEASHEDERTALFLERTYHSGATPEERRQIRTMFIELAQQKAREMGTMLVLSMDYLDTISKDFVQTKLNLYISASKAGAQYLDSLGGSATVSSEGSYKSNNFLVWQTD